MHNQDRRDGYWLDWLCRWCGGEYDKAKQGGPGATPSLKMKTEKEKRKTKSILWDSFSQPLWLNRVRPNIIHGSLCSFLFFAFSLLNSESNDTLVLIHVFLVQCFLLHLDQLTTRFDQKLFLFIIWDIKAMISCNRVTHLIRLLPFLSI